MPARFFDIRMTPYLETTVLCGILVAFKIRRNASFTASSLGKALAISGSSRTTLLPTLRFGSKRPRGRTVIFERSYSFRSSYSFRFFIEFFFMFRRLSSADHTDAIISFGMRHQQKPGFILYSRHSLNILTCLLGSFP